jgi:hypothetical protein
MMWAVFFSDGALSINDVKQIKDEKWVPVAAYRPKNDPESPATILLFKDRETAYTFTRRNIKAFQDWLKGGVELTDTDLNNIKSNHKYEVLIFPRRFDSHPDFELTYEVIELCKCPDVRYIRVSGV